MQIAQQERGYMIRRISSWSFFA